MFSKIANFFIWAGLAVAGVLAGTLILLLSTWYIWVAIWVIWLLTT